ncbi:Eukaryotic translation initiation factor 2 subunit 1 [Hondaea fermentalgiana]|uniref:Eukaryotic translation initiation factor 2 subunit 1 n=1 Tax=Hondaea fermentalgiana TaxID=2315210 RepID=A0A2R5G1U0_9STRA|nr:Eukaryotic translation initiation factor 2 subunit 1 [Hondaea fermentalgiana]|eukprot:GBG24505.1 Eukaryotic translation initiation factor 2 subunit 1 [Hondaea fermentalgiana]
MAEDAAAAAAEIISAQEREEREIRLSCRFYEEQFPALEECVMVQVKSIAEMGAYVSLLEYNNIEGMILLSELSRRRFRSINKLIRVGKLEVAMVIRVDKEKGYIDLSKRRVSKEDIIKCEERYSKGKEVNSIMRHLAETTGSNLLELNEKIAWPLAKPPYQNTHQAFRMAINDPEKVFGGLDVDQSIIDQLMVVVRRKMTPKPIKIRADIEVTCYQPEGIDAIIAALKAGEAIGKEGKAIKIKLIAPPRYVMLTTSLNKNDGFDAMNRSIDAIRTVITDRKGNINVSAEPHVTSDEEEHSLKLLMEQLESENREIAADSDEDE